MWLFYSFLSVIGTAAAVVLAKIGLKDIDSVLATALRSVVMALLAVVVTFLLGKFRNFSLINQRSVFFIVLAGLAGVFSWFFYFAALKYGQVSKVSAVDKMSLALIVIFSIVFLGESLSWKLILGSLLMVFGAFLIVLA